jgi:hypothetical protein
MSLLHACTVLLPPVAPAKELNRAVVLKPRTIVRNPDLCTRTSLAVLINFVPSFQVWLAI